MKTENQIWQDVADAVKAGLQYYEVTGFTVRQSVQPSKLTVIEPTIWIDRVSGKRYGAQSQIPIVIEGVPFTQEVYYQEVMLQITAMKKRNPETNTTATITAADCLNYVVTYLNGVAGTAKLKELGYGNIRVSEVREPSFTSHSDLYEKTPSFDLTLVHVQTEARPVNVVDAFELITKRV